MKQGLLVISHGSRDTGWVAHVDETVEVVRDRIGQSVHVETAFLELVEGRLIQDGLDRMKAAGVEELLALPLFVSAGSTHVDEIGWALGAYPAARTDTDLEKFHVAPGIALTYGKPMDDAPELLEVVLDRLREMAPTPSETCVLLIGHGSGEAGFQEAWEQGLERIAQQVMRLGGYRHCSTALLLPDQVREQAQKLSSMGPDGRIVVMGLFLSEGYFTKQVIPKRLEGLACIYSGRALMPHSRVADWIVRQAREWQACAH